MNYSQRNQQRYSQEVEDALDDGVLTTSDRSSIRSRKGLLASAVKAVSAINNMLMDNCSICTLYCDKQVQYEEYVQQQYELSAGAMGHLYSQLNGVTPKGLHATNNETSDTLAATRDVCEEDAEDSSFVNQSDMKTPQNATPSGSNHERIQVEQQYRDFLFDEESVVRSVGSRGGLDDEE